MSQQIKNNNKKNNKNKDNNKDTQVVFMAIVDAVQMIINNNNNIIKNNTRSQNQSKGKAIKTSGVAKLIVTGQASLTVGIYIPGAVLVEDSGMKLCPTGGISTKFDNAKQVSDPASIILADQALFVSAVVESNKMPSGR